MAVTFLSTVIRRLKRRRKRRIITLEEALEGIANVNNPNNEKLGLLTFISHHFEYLRGSEHKKQAVGISNRLILQLVKETDERIRVEILNTLLVIVGGYLDIGQQVDF